MLAQPYPEKIDSLIPLTNRDAVDLNCQPVFSGAALYANANICASLSPAGLAFKLGKQRCKELIQSQVAIPLCYFEGAPTKSNYALFPDPDELSDSSIGAYFNECIDYTLN